MIDQTETVLAEMILFYAHSHAKIQREVASGEIRATLDTIPSRCYTLRPRCADPDGAEPYFDRARPEDKVETYRVPKGQPPLEWIVTGAIDPPGGEPVFADATPSPIEVALRVMDDIASVRRHLLDQRDRVETLSQTMRLLQGKVHDLGCRVSIAAEDNANEHDDLKQLLHDLTDRVNRLEGANG